MSENEDGHVVLDPQDARGGKKLGVMRYVLLISITLAVIAGIIIFVSMRHG